MRFQIEAVSSEWYAVRPLRTARYLTCLLGFPFALALASGCGGVRRALVPPHGPRQEVVIVRAHPASTLVARVRCDVELRYSAPAAALDDRPPHVRGASGLTQLADGTLAVVQDDANFIGLYRPADAHIGAIPLPPGRHGRRQFNPSHKRWKMDLEACVAAAPDGLVAFGSGSLSNRESIVVGQALGTDSPSIEVVDAHSFYEALRQERRFSGASLNVEGAVRRDDRLWLFQRGNGGPSKGLRAVNATCDVSWPAFDAYLRGTANVPPTPEHIVQYDLGSVHGVPFAFTDATLVGARIVYLANAEDSPDAVHDGPVVGSAVGTIDLGGDSGHPVVRWTVLRDLSGAPFLGKAEGILPADGSSTHFWVVVDRDDPKRAAELCELTLEDAHHGAATANQEPNRRLETQTQKERQ